MRYCKRNRERDGDVFMSSKMMIFQNNGVWERWVMDNGVLKYVCCVVIYEEGICKKDGGVWKCVCGSKMSEVSK